MPQSTADEIFRLTKTCRTRDIWNAISLDPGYVRFTDWLGNSVRIFYNPRKEGE